MASGTYSKVRELRANAQSITVRIAWPSRRPALEATLWANLTAARSTERTPTLTSSSSIRLALRSRRQGRLRRKDAVLSPKYPRSTQLSRSLAKPRAATSPIVLLDARRPCARTVRACAEAGRKFCTSQCAFCIAGSQPKEKPSVFPCASAASGFKKAART